MTGISSQITIIKEGDTNTDRVCSGSCNFDFQIRIHKELLGEEFDITTSQFTCKIIFPNENETEGRAILSTIYPPAEVPSIIAHLKISAQYNDLKNCGCVEHILNEWFDDFVKILNIKNKSSCLHDIEIEYPFKVNLDSFPLIKFGGNIAGLVELKKTDVEYAISNINSEIRLQYSLMLNAHSFFVKNDYRNCVLSCATIIEICLSDIIQGRLSSNNEGLDSNSDARNQIIKNCNGLIGLHIFLNKFGKNLFAISQNELKEKIGDIRNKAIHSGYTPTKNESEVALELCQTVLKRHYADDYFMPATTPEAV